MDPSEDLGVCLILTPRSISYAFTTRILAQKKARSNVPPPTSAAYDFRSLPLLASLYMMTEYKRAHLG